MLCLGLLGGVEWSGWLTDGWDCVAAEREEHDAGAADDRERSVWDAERGVERVQAVEELGGGLVFMVYYIGCHSQSSYHTPYGRGRGCTGRKLELPSGQWILLAIHLQGAASGQEARSLSPAQGCQLLPVAADRHGKFARVLHALVDERVTHTFQGRWRGLALLRR